MRIITQKGLDMTLGHKTCGWYKKQNQCNKDTPNFTGYTC